MNIFNKWKIYSDYKKIISQNKLSLYENHNIKIDYANRLYTVVHVPSDEIGEAYTLKKTDVDRIAQRYIREYMSSLSTFFISIGINEMIDFYQPIQKVGKTSYLIVLGFKILNTVKINKIIWYVVAPIILVSIIILFIVI